MFLQSGAVPPSLADNIQRLEAAGREARRDNDEESIEDEHETQQVIQDWMLICQYNTEFAQVTLTSRTVIGHWQLKHIQISWNCRLSLHSSVCSMSHLS